MGMLHIGSTSTAIGLGLTISGLYDLCRKKDGRIKALAKVGLGGAALAAGTFAFTKAISAPPFELDSKKCPLQKLTQSEFKEKISTSFMEPYVSALLKSNAIGCHNFGIKKVAAIPAVLLEATSKIDQTILWGIDEETKLHGPWKWILKKFDNGSKEFQAFKKLMWINDEGTNFFLIFQNSYWKNEQIFKEGVMLWDSVLGPARADWEKGPWSASESFVYDLNFEKVQDIYEKYILKSFF